MARAGAIQRRCFLSRRRPAPAISTSEPAYRDGDVVVVLPGTPVRRGDRVVVKTTGGEVIVGELRRRTAKTLELASLHRDQAEQTLPADDVAWIAQVAWVRQ